MQVVFLLSALSFNSESRYSRENGNSIPQALTKRYSKGKNRRQQHLRHES